MIEETKDSQKRRHLTPEQKVAILKAHLVDRKSIADLCDQHRIQPSQFYRWQQELFERGRLAFENHHTERPSATLERKVVALEQKLVRKDSVLAELMEEHVALKKSLGEN